MSEPNAIVKVGNVVFSNEKSFSLIAGPCQIESRDHAFEMAGRIKTITDQIGIGFVYKSSYDKANRTSLNAERGVGLENAMAIFLT